MARTQSIARAANLREKARKREKPLGVAVALGLATVLAAALFIEIALFLTPHSVLHNFYLLSRYNASATLPLDPLYQKWEGIITNEDMLFVTPFSLLCGGLVLGRLAPSYTALRRVLLAGGLMGLAVLLTCIGFVWPTAVFQQNTMNAHEGGQQVALTAPPALIATQVFLTAASTAVCILGTRLGVWLRDRNRLPLSESVAR